jgi:NhaC family Na+:H+ antiporter
MQISPALTGGAILAGAYWGDRCSPVSTSALLVAELTHTSIFHNIRKMLRTAVIPFLAACAIYTALGFFSKSNGDVPDLTALFCKEFHLHWIALLPAIVILVLSLFQVKVKIRITLGIL